MVNLIRNTWPVFISARNDRETLKRSRPLSSQFYPFYSRGILEESKWTGQLYRYLARIVDFFFSLNLDFQGDLNTFEGRRPTNIFSHRFHCRALNPPMTNTTKSLCLFQKYFTKSIVNDEMFYIVNSWETIYCMLFTEIKIFFKTNLSWVIDFWPSGKAKIRLRPYLRVTKKKRNE